MKSTIQIDTDNLASLVWLLHDVNDVPELAIEDVREFLHQCFLGGGVKKMKFDSETGTLDMTLLVPPGELGYPWNQVKVYLATDTLVRIRSNSNGGYRVTFKM